MNHKKKINAPCSGNDTTPTLNTTANTISSNVKNPYNIFTFCLAIITILLSFTAPEACKAALLNSYNTCVNQLLYALFPFLIAANLLVLCGVAPILGKPFKPLCRLFGFTEPCVSGIFAIAMLGGFAPAISAMAQSVKLGQLSSAKASKLLPLLCFLGPSYVIVAVGAGMLGSLQTGVYLFCSQVIASVLTAAIFCIDSLFFSKRNAGVTATKRTDASRCGINSHNIVALERNAGKHPSIATPAIPTVIGDAFFAFLRLCAVVMYFQFLSAGLCTFCPAQYQWLCECALEVTAACDTIAATGLHSTYRCCIALSCLSGSILLQAIALCPAGVSAKPLLLSRLLHLPIALLALHGFLSIPQPETVYNSLAPRVIAMQRLPLDQAMLLFIALVFLIQRLRNA